LTASTSSTPSRQSLRNTLRQRRRALSRQQQKQASRDLCRQLLRLPEFINARRIAAYLPNDGEIDPRPLLQLAWQLGKSTYLPVLHPLKRGQLQFLPYHAQQTMVLNRFGIPEPVGACEHSCATWTLDLVLAPLVGFDASGNRMGMGGGFYDRTFAFLQQGNRPRQPHLFGVAHQCQQVDQLPSEPWDIAMDKIITDGGAFTAAVRP